eukprot:scaffold34706_cov165-Amphora_coffeaeformis.AAC.3
MMYSTVNTPVTNRSNLMGGAYFSSSTVERDDPSDFDISGIFEDESILDNQDEFAVPQSMKQQFDILKAVSFPKTTSQGIPSPPTSSRAEYVNLYMVVDPVTGQTTCPNQVLTFNDGGILKTALVGPSLRFDGLIGGRDLQSHHQQLHLSPPCFPKTDQLTQELNLKNIYDDPVEAPTSCENLKNIFNAPMEVSLSCDVPSVTNAGHQHDSETQTSHEESILHQLFASAMETSAPAFSKTTANPPKNAKLPEEKSANSPFRPLSAYNFFFQTERDKILNATARRGDDFTEAMKRRILQAHWTRDRTQKRRHRKSHGRISFIELSKQISARWKKLPEQDKEFYRDVSAIDHARFKRESEHTSSS